MDIKVNEKTTATVNQKKQTIKMYDIEFTLVKKSDYSKESYPCIIYSITSPEWDFPVGGVCHNLEDGKRQREAFEAFQNGIGEGLSRTGADIYQAAARMLAQII